MGFGQVGPVQVGNHMDLKGVMEEVHSSCKPRVEKELESLVSWGDTEVEGRERLRIPPSFLAPAVGYAAHSGGSFGLTT